MDGKDIRLMCSLQLPIANLRLSLSSVVMWLMLFTFLDYGLPSFRVPNVINDVEEGGLRQAVVHIYLPPEAKGKSNPVPTG